MQAEAEKSKKEIEKKRNKKKFIELISQ